MSNKHYILTLLPRVHCFHRFSRRHIVLLSNKTSRHNQRFRLMLFFLSTFCKTEIYDSSDLSGLHIRLCVH